MRCRVPRRRAPGRGSTDDVLVPGVPRPGAGPCCGQRAGFPPRQRPAGMAAGGQEPGRVPARRDTGSCLPDRRCARDLGRAVRGRGAGRDGLPHPRPAVRGTPGGCDHPPARWTARAAAAGVPRAVAGSGTHRRVTDGAVRRTPGRRQPRSGWPAARYPVGRCLARGDATMSRKIADCRGLGGTCNLMIAGETEEVLAVARSMPCPRTGARMTSGCGRGCGSTCGIRCPARARGARCPWTCSATARR